MLITLALSLLVVLSVLRRVLEPACPGCAAKEWTHADGVLTCKACDWSTTAAVPQAVEAPVPAGQYEIAFG